MTLCIGALCKEGRDDRFVFSSDIRLETDIAGGDIGFKVQWARAGWPVMYAGATSKALDLIASLHHSLGNDAIDGPEEFAQRLRAAVHAHKTRLSDDLVRRKLGISLERFLERGKNEIPADVRRETFFEIVRTDLGCELIVGGFIGDSAALFVVDQDGEVSWEQNFAAIGSGASAAETLLFKREQQSVLPLGVSLYHVYEAHRLAGGLAPGVSRAMHIAIYRPSQGPRGLHARIVNDTKVLAEHYERYGLKDIMGDLKLPDSFHELRDEG